MKVPTQLQNHPAVVISAVIPSNAFILLISFLWKFVLKYKLPLFKMLEGGKLLREKEMCNF